MDQSHRWIAKALLILTATVILVGCQTPARDIPESGSVTDPCADQLHDISGHLLLYYSLNKRLPQTLDNLRAVSGRAEAPPLVCPVPGKRYIYRPEGLQVPGRSGRLVLYDAAPIHLGMRWAIILLEPEGGRPLGARVILLPEQSVRAAVGALAQSPAPLRAA